MDVRENQLQPQGMTGHSPASRRGGIMVDSNFFGKYAIWVTIVACVANSIGNSLISWVVAATFALLVLKPEFLLGPIIFFTILDDFLLITPSISYSRIITLVFIAGAAFSILYKGKIRMDTLHVIFLMLMGIAFSMVSLLGYTSIPISYLLNLGLAVAMMNYTPESVEKVVKHLGIYANVSLVYIAYLLFSSGLDALVDGVRLSVSEGTNSNQVAMGLAVVMALLTCKLLVFKKNKLLIILLMLLTCLCLFLSGSRTGLLAAVITMFCLFIANATDRRSRRTAVLFLIFSVAALIGVYVFLQARFPILMARFTVDNVQESGGSGRMEVWMAYFRDYFPENWLFGIGFDSLNLYYAVQASNGEGHGAHNVIVEIISKTGVFGLTVYTLFFTKFFRFVLSAIRKNKLMLFSFAITVSLLINGMGENVMGSRFLWLGVGLGYMLMSYEKKQS